MNRRDLFEKRLRGLLLYHRFKFILFVSQVFKLVVDVYVTTVVLFVQGSNF